MPNSSSARLSWKYINIFTNRCGDDEKAANLREKFVSECQRVNKLRNGTMKL